MKIAALLASSLIVGLMTAAAAPQDGQRRAEAAFAAARAVSPTPLSVDEEHRTWLEDRAMEGADIADTDTSWTERWTASAARDRATRAAAVSPDALARDCVSVGLNGCKSNQGGYLRGPSGETLYWQIQEGATDTDGVSGGAVLLVRDGDILRPVAWTSGGFYEPPQLIETGDPAEVYVALPGYSGGTGHHNADVVFRWRPGAAVELTEIDTYSWRATLDTRLPSGLEVWKGVEFSWPVLTAQTPLWRPDDANCCATGGEAMLIFAIHDGALLLSQVGVEDALTELAMTVPTDVFDFVGRWALCEHWGGEEGYDDDRRAQIADAVTRLRCATLETDEAALRTKYADEPQVLALFTRPPSPSVPT